jgi:hypothetical protein
MRFGLRHMINSGMNLNLDFSRYEIDLENSPVTAKAEIEFADGSKGTRFYLGEESWFDFAPEANGGNGALTAHNCSMTLTSKEGEPQTALVVIRPPKQAERAHSDDRVT